MCRTSPLQATTSCRVNPFTVRPLRSLVMARVWQAVGTRTRRCGAPRPSVTVASRRQHIHYGPNTTARATGDSNLSGMSVTGCQALTLTEGRCSSVPVPERPPRQSACYRCVLNAPPHRRLARRSIYLGFSGTRSGSVDIRPEGLPVGSGRYADGGCVADSCAVSRSSTRRPSTNQQPFGLGCTLGPPHESSTTFGRAHQLVLRRWGTPEVGRRRQVVACTLTTLYEATARWCILFSFFTLCTS